MRPGPEHDRKRFLAATDNLLDRIEELRLEGQLDVPQHLASRLEAVAHAMDARLRSGAPRTLASAHEQVFRLQTKLLRTSGLAAVEPRPPRRRAPSATAPVAIPTRESSETEAAWLERVQLTVQRAQDRVRYLTAQVETAKTSPLADDRLRAARQAQAADAETALAEVTDDARRITGRPVRIDPPPTYPPAGRAEIADLVVQDDAPDVLKRGRPIRLTHHERMILIVLAANRDRVVTREALQHVVTRADPLLDVRSTVMSVHIANLRAKLGRRYVDTVPGIGYRLPPGLSARLPELEEIQRRRMERSHQVRGGASSSPPERQPQPRPNRRPPSRS
jgi:DNA-binding response OmpR family regulator